MAYVDWMISGPKIASCNCNYGCPCEFNAPPTYPICEGLEAHRIDEGWFGDVRLEGIIIVARYRWPGPVHEGGGIVQGAISAHASDEQRDALFKILGGEEQVPTTPFNIYGSTIEREIDPVFADIEFECDIANRTGSFRVPGIMEMTLEPIRNPVTGDPYEAIIELPKGFEFRRAHMASGTFRAGGDDLAMDHADRYGFLTEIAYGPNGVIDAR